MQNGYSDILRRLEGFSPDRARTAITLSFAQSLDGSIAFEPGSRTHLSNDVSLEMTHGLRARHDAVVVGVGTILVDNPRLTARTATACTQPRRVILDRALRTPPSARVFECDGGMVCIATTDDAPQSHARELEAAGAEVWRWPRQAFEPHHLRGALHQRGIQSAMVEGGATLLSTILDAGAFDYAVITISPKLNARREGVRYARGSRATTYDLTHCEQTLLHGDIVLDGPMA
ncbi:MAG: dihydrofolate reductase family protein [Myxococcota bacterium]